MSAVDHSVPMVAPVFYAGQIIGLISDIPTVQELFDRIVGEARDLMTCRFPAVVQEVASSSAG
jgi:hypothetical protein